MTPDIMLGDKENGEIVAPIVPYLQIPETKLKYQVRQRSFIHIQKLFKMHFIAHDVTVFENHQKCLKPDNLPMYFKGKNQVSKSIENETL